MDQELRGGWVYMMADHYRGSIYVGVTAHLARRVYQHRQGTGSDYCAKHKLHRLVWAERGETIDACIAHEKRLKRWRREWKFDLIERGNPDWADLYDLLVY
jgi:putative endonuclease